MIYRIYLYIILVTGSFSQANASDQINGSMACKVTSDRITEVSGSDIYFYDSIKNEYSTGDTLILSYTFSNYLAVLLSDPFNEKVPLRFASARPVSDDFCADASLCSYYRFFVNHNRTMIYEDSIGYMELSPRHLRIRKSVGATHQLTLRKYEEGKFSGYYFYEGMSEGLNFDFTRVNTLDCRGSNEEIIKIIEQIDQATVD